MDAAQSSGAVPDPLRVLILSGPLTRPDKDALRSYIQTNLQLLYPYRESKVDLCPLPSHSLRSRLEDITKLATFIEKHDKHDTLRYDWVLPLFYLPPLTEPMYLDIEEDAVNIVQSIAVEAAKTAKHVLFTTIAQSITEPSIPSITELNEKIQKHGAIDGSHLLNISLLLAHWNNPAHPETYSFTSHRIAHHIALYEHKWDNEEKLGLYHLSEQTKNILPDDSEFYLEKAAKPVAQYRPFLTQKCTQFVQHQRQQAAARIELDFRCAQNMAKDGGGFNHLQGIEINNVSSMLGIAHPPSIISQALQTPSLAPKTIADVNNAAACPSPKGGSPQGLPQPNYPGNNIVEPDHVMDASYVPFLTGGIKVARMREEKMPMGSDGIRRLSTINGMPVLELRRPVDVVEIQFRRSRKTIIRKVAEPVVKSSKRTHSAASEAARDEDENDVLAVKSASKPNKGTHSAAFSAGKKKGGIPMVLRRQRHDKAILREIINVRPVRVERPGRVARGHPVKSVKKKKGKKGKEKRQGPGSEWRKGKGKGMK